ncbi:MAG: radical SAM protein, partial [Nitrospinota bacterium]
LGMSSLGFQKLWGLFAAHPDFSCERVFLEEEGGAGELLRSLETHTPLREFDLVAFSLSFEHDYLNMVRMLRLGGIPPLRSERTHSQPLVLAGGVAPSCNPEPLAPIADLVVLGEGEGVPEELAAALQEGDLRRTGEKPSLRLAMVPGFYLPAGYLCEYDRDGVLRRLEPKGGFPPLLSRRYLSDLDASPTRSLVLTDRAELAHLFLLEAGRGGEAGLPPAPLRHRSTASLLEEVRLGLRFRHRVGLVGEASSLHPDLLPLAEQVRAGGGALSLTHLPLSVLTEDLVARLGEGALEGASLPVGGATERLRRLAGAGVSDEAVEEAVEVLLRGGVTEIRMSFLIGLPTEDREEVDGIHQLVRALKRRMARARRAGGPQAALTLEIRTFVPRPSGPLAREAFEELESLKGKLRHLKALLGREQWVRASFDLPKWAYIQCLLARGDRRVGELLVEVDRLGGDWRAACARKNLNPDYYVSRRWEEGDLLPWAHVAAEPSPISLAGSPLP